MRKGYKAFLAVILLTVAFVTTTLAQVPCSGDPDDPNYDPNGCAPAPLDTWVIVLVALALFFGYRHLQKQKKSLAV